MSLIAMQKDTDTLKKPPKERLIEPIKLEGTISSKKYEDKKRENRSKVKVGDIDLQNLGSIAPIAIVMYCFNEHPRFTMLSLAGMLIVVLLNNDSSKKKLQKLRAIIMREWYDFKSRALYICSGQRF